VRQVGEALRLGLAARATVATVRDVVAAAGGQPEPRCMNSAYRELEKLRPWSRQAGSRHVLSRRRWGRLAFGPSRCPAATNGVDRGVRDAHAAGMENEDIEASRCCGSSSHTRCREPGADPDTKGESDDNQCVHRLKEQRVPTGEKKGGAGWCGLTSRGTRQARYGGLRCAARVGVYDMRVQPAGRRGGRRWWRQTGGPRTTLSACWRGALTPAMGT